MSDETKGKLWFWVIWLVVLGVIVGLVTKPFKKASEPMITAIDGSSPDGYFVFRVYCDIIQGTLFVTRTAYSDITMPIATHVFSTAIDVTARQTDTILSALEFSPVTYEEHSTIYGIARIVDQQGIVYDGEWYTDLNTPAKKESNGMYKMKTFYHYYFPIILN